MIASAFPGQLDYIELLNMDVRDLRFWFIEAQKKLVQDQMKRIQAARMAMAENTAYSKILSEFERQLHSLSPDGEDRIRENWQDLKQRGKG